MADDWAGYMWKWVGYIRRTEREQWMIGREIVAIIHNTNVKKGQTKSGRKLFPLEIDNIRIFTPEQAKKQFDAAMNAGWFKNHNLN